MIYWSGTFLYVFFFCVTYFLENSWITLFVLFFAIPFLDRFFKLDEENPTFEQQQELRKELYIIIILFFINSIRI